MSRKAAAMTKNLQLNRTFCKLGMGVEFIDRAKKMGLSDLSDLMKVNLAKLKAHRDFTYSWYTELLNMLKGNGLLQEFQKRTLED